MHRSPIMIGLVGDVHGTLKTAVRAIRALASEGITEIHFLGDFGFLWDGSHSQDQLLDMLSACLAENGAIALVTGGNHDSYDEWSKVPENQFGIRWTRKNIVLLPRAWRASSPNGNIIASFGGANSIDKFSRLRRGEPHWDAEQITEQDLLALGTDKVDILLGHDAPKSPQLLELLAANETKWEPAGLAYSEQGQSMYQRAVDQVRPRMTVSGHYHLNLDVVERFTARGKGSYETRVVILNADGNSSFIAALNTDSLELFYPMF